METIECIKKRRSVRKFLDKDVPKEIIEKIIDAANHAPSSFGEGPWKFIATKDKQLMKKLLKDRAQLTEPDYDIDHKRYVEKEKIKYTEISLPPVLIAVCGERKRCPYQGSLISSVTLSVENLLLAATDIGLAGCWLYVYDPDTPSDEKYIKEVLNLKENMLILCMIVLGYPDPKFKLNPKKMRKLEEILEWR